MEKTPRRRAHASSTTTSLSSAATAQSKRPTGLLELGTALSRELGTHEGVDTLGRWMAHYLAEQLQLVEQSSGVTRSRAETKIAQLIIQIWKHRGSLPGSVHPLANLRKAATALTAVTVGRSARTQWRTPLHAPQTACLALECFEQASILASLGVFELLPDSLAEIPDVIKEFLNDDEKAFLDGIQNVYSAATTLLNPAAESAVTSMDQAFLQIQLKVILKLEASLAALRSNIELSGSLDNK